MGFSVWFCLWKCDFEGEIDDELMDGKWGARFSERHPDILGPCPLAEVTKSSEVYLELLVIFLPVPLFFWQHPSTHISKFLLYPTGNRLAERFVHKSWLVCCIVLGPSWNHKSIAELQNEPALPGPVDWRLGHVGATLPKLASRRWFWPPKRGGRGPSHSGAGNRSAVSSRVESLIRRKHHRDLIHTSSNLSQGICSLIHGDGNAKHVGVSPRCFMPTLKNSNSHRMIPISTWFNIILSLGSNTIMQQVPVINFGETITTPFSTFLLGCARGDTQTGWMNRWLVESHRKTMA